MRTVHLLRKLDDKEWGGTETAIVRLFEGLKENGVESVAYCPRLEHRAGADTIGPGCRVKRFRAFIPVFGLSRERRRQLTAVGGNLMSFDLMPSLWRERDAQIIHTHVLGRLGGLARVVARRRRIPFVVSIHGGAMDLPEKMRQSIQAARKEGWEWGRPLGWILGSRELFRDADAIIACNETEATLLRKSYPDKRVVVQPHGIPLNVYQKDQRQAALEAFPQIQGRQMLLCLGRIDPIKNQAWLIDQMPEICRKHSKALLVLTGPCTNEPYGQAVDKKIAELGLKDRVLQTGALPPNDPRLIGLLQESSAVVLPSVSETFGLIILEAWVAGAAVLSSRASGPAALIRQGENGWLFSLDQPDCFHQALDRTLEDPALAKKLARAGAKASAEFGLGAMASRLKSLYEELIQEKRCVM